MTCETISGRIDKIYRIQLLKLPRFFYLSSMPKKDLRWKYHLKMKIAKMAYGVALLCAVLTLNPAMGQSARPTPPTRDPNTPGYVTAKELPDGTNPQADAEGNFIIGLTHNRAPEMIVQTNVPQGTVYDFAMNSVHSKIYPGIAR